MTPLLRLDQAVRRFSSLGQSIDVLKSINLSIYAGEMIAIMGASGSGKSTLVNILGCIDQLNEGAYWIAGEEVSGLDSNALAKLRREHFGFVFQRYHLLSHLSAIDNVEMPAIYAGTDKGTRRVRAKMLLAQIGLADRIYHLPSQLSGGQQQRVSIARALMNGGQVILADEPTGALDSQSGEEVLKVLQGLHALGHTVIIVTHDTSVASHAQRIIEMKDGQIIHDSPNPHYKKREIREPSIPAVEKKVKVTYSGNWKEWKEALKMAWHTMLSHRLRTVLTMLGVVMGIMSVVSITALGEGAKNYVLDDIRSIGTNTIDIFPGKDWGDDKAAGVRTLLPADVTALQAEPYIESASPVTTTRMRLRHRNKDVNVTVHGVGEQFLTQTDMDKGVLFGKKDIVQQSQAVLIDHHTKRKLFGAYLNPIGEVILLGSVPFRIMGVLGEKKNRLANNQELNVYIPYSTAASRVFGRTHLDRVQVRVARGYPAELAESNIHRLLLIRHRDKDFFIFNMDSIVKAAESVSRSLTLLLSSIAFISLVVGGIGVMNITLVSVVERVKEIGIRMAVGARQRDIMQQFLTEAVLICLIGGIIGVALSFGASLIFDLFVTEWKMVFSVSSVLIAFLFAMLTGMIFGYLPARKAARLVPIEALAHD